MPVPYNEIAWIKDRLERAEKQLGALEQIEKRIASLEKATERRVASQGKWDQTVMGYFSLYGGKFADIYDRLINLEVKIFPNLLKGIESVDKVIGDKPSPAFNPLDYRPAEKRQPKKPGGKT